MTLDEASTSTSTVGTGANCSNDAWTPAATLVNERRNARYAGVWFSTYTANARCTGRPELLTSCLNVPGDPTTSPVPTSAVTIVELRDPGLHWLANPDCGLSYCVKSGIPLNAGGGSTNSLVVNATR